VDEARDVSWLGIILRGLFYAISIALMFPALILFRVDQRRPNIDDGFELGYDDNDKGRDVDE
jgi:hypothetical protein